MITDTDDAQILKMRLETASKMLDLDLGKILARMKTITHVLGCDMLTSARLTYKEILRGEIDNLR